VRYEGSSALHVAGAFAVAPIVDRIVRGLFYIYVISLPFHRLLFLERNGFLLLLGLLGVWCAVNRTHFFVRTPIDLPLIAFVGWVGLSIPFATFPSYSVKEFGKLLEQVVVFYMVLRFFYADPHRSRLLWTLIGTSVIVSLYGIAQFMGMVGILPATKRLTAIESFTPGEVWLTTYLVMIIPIGFVLSLFEQRRAEKAVYFGATALNLLCLLLTFSRAGVLSLLTEIGIIVSLVRRKLLVVVSLVMITVIVLLLWVSQNNVHTVEGTALSRGLGYSSLLHRLEIWEFTTHKILQHPLLGVGYGKDNFQLVYQESGEDVQPRHAPVLDAGTHNIVLDLALGAGIPAALLFVWLVWRIAAVALQQFQKSDSPLHRAISLAVGVSVIGMVVRLLFDQMLIGTLAIQFWVIVAIGLGTTAMTDTTGKSVNEQKI
jgi:O-antigen ligase